MLLGLAWSPTSVAVAAIGVVTVYCVLERLYFDFRIRKAGGVRTREVTSNTFTAMLFLVRAGIAQSKNRFLEFFEATIAQGFTPSETQSVEFTTAGRRIIVTVEPEQIKTVLTGKFAQYGKGELFHTIWKPFLGDSIFTTDGQLWHQSRTLIRPMFTKDRVRDIDMFDHWTGVLMNKIPTDGQTVDVCDLFYRMTLDVTTGFLLGDSVGSLENPNSEFSRAFTEVQRSQMIFTLMSPVRHFLPSGKYYRGIKTLERFMDPFIKHTLSLSTDELEKLSRSDKEFTFLHNIALLSRDPKVIRDQIMAVLLAGRDTTASTLSWAIYEISNYPIVWKKLRDIVLETVGPTRAPTYEDLKEMTYLTHILNETLRLYPAVPYNLRQCVEYSTLPGKLGQPDIGMAPGDMVAYSTMAMQRRKDLYPPVSDTFADPAIFSPERWEHWTPKSWQFIPFNGGPRICIGQNFAMTEMAFTMVRFAQKYQRIEYRGDWRAQYHKAELVGCPGQGVPVALFEAEKK